MEEDSPVDDLTRFSVLAKLLDEEEEPPTSVMPRTRIGQMTEYKAVGYYTCNFCRKPYRDIASKNRYQAVCTRAKI